MHFGLTDCNVVDDQSHPETPTRAGGGGVLLQVRNNSINVMRSRQSDESRDKARESRTRMRDDARRNRERLLDAAVELVLKVGG
jgi:hypothetical protein